MKQTKTDWGRDGLIWKEQENLLVSEEESGPGRRVLSDTPRLARGHPLYAPSRQARRLTLNRHLEEVIGSLRGIWVFNKDLVSSTHWGTTPRLPDFQTPTHLYLGCLVGSETWFPEPPRNLCFVWCRKGKRAMSSWKWTKRGLQNNFLRYFPGLA